MHSKESCKSWIIILMLLLVSLKKSYFFKEKKQTSERKRKTYTFWAVPFDIFTFKLLVMFTFCTMSSDSFSFKYIRWGSKHISSFPGIPVYLSLDRTNIFFPTETIHWQICSEFKMHNFQLKQIELSWLKWTDATVVFFHCAMPSCSVGIAWCVIHLIWFVNHNWVLSFMCKSDYWGLNKYDLWTQSILYYPHAAKPETRHDMNTVIITWCSSQTISIKQACFGKHLKSQWN